MTYETNEDCMFYDKGVCRKSYNSMNNFTTGDKWKQYDDCDTIDGKDCNRKARHVGGVK